MLNTYFFKVTFTDTAEEWEDECEYIEVREREEDWAFAEAEETAEKMVKAYGDSWKVASIELENMEEADYSGMTMYEYYGYEYGTDLWN